ncbi:MAG: V-type ATP synthase subunit D, partial [Casimicrobiaceae bacterium]
MSEASPTRAVMLELKDEQKAMHEGYVFLDEKCLLLAGEILRELAHYAKLDQAFLDAHKIASEALRDAVTRHGLDDLQVYPALDQTAGTLARTARSVMGVRLQDAAWRSMDATYPPSVQPSPEAEAC